MSENKQSRMYRLLEELEAIVGDDDDNLCDLINDSNDAISEMDDVIRRTERLLAEYKPPSEPKE